MADSKPLSGEQFAQAELCLHSLLQCIYGAPVHHGEREHAFMRCHATAAHCYSHLTTPPPLPLPGSKDDEQLDPLLSLHT